MLTSTPDASLPTVLQLWAGHDAMHGFHGLRLDVSGYSIIATEFMTPTLHCVLWLQVLSQRTAHNLQIVGQ